MLWKIKRKLCLVKANTFKVKNFLPTVKMKLFILKGQKLGKITKKSLTAEKVKQAQRQYQEKTANL